MLELPGRCENVLGKREIVGFWEKKQTGAKIFVPGVYKVETQHFVSLRDSCKYYFAPIGGGPSGIMPL